VPTRRLRALGRRIAGIAGIAVLGVCLLSGGGCAKKAPIFAEVPPADELYGQGLKTLKGRRILGVVPVVDYSGAIESFQTIIDNYPYSEYAVKAELRIADAYFSDKRYDEALSYYRDFADLHPQHEKVPYTILRSALCHYEQIRSVNRDQTSTRDALGYLNQLVRSHPFAPETREGEALLRELRGRLARNVMETGDFYLGRDEYQAAAQRYRDLLDVYPGLGLDAEALYKLAVCYENMKRRDEALRLYRVIVENYRNTRIADDAAGRIAARR
jgi:outer membrane protein assembly factor BamD